MTPSASVPRHAAITAGAFLLLSCDAVPVAATIPVTEGSPPMLGPVDVMVVEQILDTVEVTSSTVLDEQPPVVIGLALSTPTELPLPAASSAEACWRYRHELDDPGGKLAEGIEVTVGTTDLNLSDSGGGVYMTIAAGTTANAASQPGASLSVNGEPTEVAVPYPLQVEDIGATWTGVTKDGTVPLSWTPPPEQRPLGFIQLVIEGSEDEVWCALTDDGAADIDLGSPQAEPTIVRFGRVELQVLEHTSLGALLVAVQQDLQLVE
ncbi:hypothetical protein L6R53_14440 [Myxococcota bacterium]|nr:hypothetical protein [Myxococcota bacterium]